MKLNQKAGFAARHPFSAIKYAALRSPSVRRLWWRHTAALFCSRLTSLEASHAVREPQLIELQEHIQQCTSTWEAADPSGMVTFFGHKPLILYSIVRLTQPSVVVETGVASGISTAFILAALDRNGAGMLHSVDLPNADPHAKIPDGTSPGWLIPRNLSKRWNLTLGDAKSELEPLLTAVGPVDIFIHDSLHTYDHMMFEYASAWPHLREGGLLMSDDVNSNTAFLDFAEQVGRPPILASRFGGIRK